MITNETKYGRVAWWVAAGVTAVVSMVVLGGCNDEDTSAYDLTAATPDTNLEDDSVVAASASDQPAPKAKPARIVDKTFDDLKFDIEPDEPFEREMLSDEVKELFGQRIRIRGYIRPTFQREGIKQFIFVRDNLECCFGPGAALYDCIIVDMVPGETATFTTRPVAVEGKFTLDEFLGPEGNHLAIFHMDGEKVE